MWRPNGAGIVHGDWMMDLPEALEEAFRTDLYDYEQEYAMRYVTSIERLAMKEGMEKGLRQGLCEGIATALEARFGADSHKLLRRIRALDDLDALRALSHAAHTATTFDEVRKLLPRPSRANGGAK